MYVSVWGLVQTLFIALLLSSVLCSEWGDDYDDDDDDDDDDGRRRSGRFSVCIIGGGASGVQSAIDLVELGYKNIRLYERFADTPTHSGLGGHCDTVEGYDGEAILEPGVIVYPDTERAEREFGSGPWDVDMKKDWVERFAGNDSVVPEFFQGLPTFAFDFAHGLFLGPSSFTPDAAWQAEFARFLNLMNTTYRWMETLDSVPDPFPRELLLSLDGWLTLNNFTLIRNSFLGSIFYGGFGSFDKVKAFDALMQRTLINLIYGIPDTWFSVKRGCQSVYDGAHRFFDSIDRDIVRTNVTINRIWRPRRSSSSAPVIVTGTRNGRHFIDRCDEIVVAIQQTRSNLEALMDLTPEEIDVFENVTVSRGYWIAIYNATVGPESPIASGNGAFLFSNVDAFSPDFLPTFPSVLVTFRRDADGPAALQMYSDSSLNASSATALANDALQKLVASGTLRNAKLIRVYPHTYGINWPVQDYTGPVAPQNRVTNMQGKNRTYWVGALLYSHNTMGIKHRTKRTIRTHFPPRNGHPNEQSRRTYEQSRTRSSDGPSFTAERIAQMHGRTIRR